MRISQKYNKKEANEHCFFSSRTQFATYCSSIITKNRMIYRQGYKGSFDYVQDER